VRLFDVGILKVNERHVDDDDAFGCLMFVFVSSSPPEDLPLAPSFAFLSCRSDLLSLHSRQSTTHLHCIHDIQHLHHSVHSVVGSLLADWF